MFNERLRFIVIVVLVVLCSACSTTEEIKPIPQETENNLGENPPTSTTESKTYTETLTTNLKVDAVLDIPDEKNIPLLEVNDHVFDENKLAAVLLESKGAVKKENESEVVFTYKDNKLRISKESSSFNFVTTMGDHASTLINNMSDKMDASFKLEELDSIKKSKAVEQVAAVFGQLELTPHLPSKVYALDHHTLQQEQDLLMQDENFKFYVDLGKTKVRETWNKDDESYYMIFSIDMHGLPIASTGYTLRSSEVEVPSSEVRVVFSKRGIESFEIVGSIYAEQGSKVAPSSLISMEQALDSLKEKYDAIILKDELTVTRISIVYVPVFISSNVDSKTGVLFDKKMEMVPAWYFNIDRKYSKGDHINTEPVVVRINAITGEEIL
ncbi:hypothetical protein PAECIP111893_03969 [Paenibacillus plantiphilus]|uniref:Lipoprotein n=1 Tax=Paenibacillus plantiphilus TaxID=2905650 RepID=A0ABN8GY35_9BACL|nr:hypothetical protein [Paenibacillus plantiphilus]CAH1215437.1 hypothetical protein PAECIP111893_03969 [Paenibacillus plantiphilus]